MRLDSLPLSGVRLTLAFAALTATTVHAQTPTIGSVDEPCGQAFYIFPNGGEFYSAKVKPGRFDDWQLDVSAKEGPRLGLLPGDITNNHYKTLAGNYRLTESPQDAVFALVTFPEGRVVLNSGDLRTGFNFMEATVLQVVGESSDTVSMSGEVDLPNDRAAYTANLGAGPESFPRGVAGGVEIAFAPLVELGPTMGCDAAGFAPEPESEHGLVAGYNVYRTPDDGTFPSPAEVGAIDNWIYFAPTRPDVAVPDALSTLHDPNGIVHDGDEVVTFRDVATNPDGSARQIGAAPEPGRRYWYAVQPVLMGAIDDWADLTLAWQELAEYPWTDGLRGDWRIDSDGDGLLDAIELPRATPPDPGNGPEFLSPQAEAGLIGLGLTHGGVALLSPLIPSDGTEAFEDCANSLDDDGDGYTDCDDPDCDCLLGGRIDVGRPAIDELMVRWDSQLAALPVDIHSGSLENLWLENRLDHAALACELPGRQASLPMPAAAVYFLVTGDFGADSFGTPRPPSTAGCP